MFSRSTVHALQVMGYIARNAGYQPLKLEQVSANTGIPRHAVVKVVQAMHKQRLLATSRGSHGGVSLTKSPGGVLLSEIVCAVDGPPDDCPVSTGAETCHPTLDCCLYQHWEKLARQLNTLRVCKDLKRFADQNIAIDL